MKQKRFLALLLVSLMSVGTLVCCTDSNPDEGGENLADSVNLEEMLSAPEALSVSAEAADAGEWAGLPLSARDNEWEYSGYPLAMSSDLTVLTPGAYTVAFDFCIEQPPAANGRDLFVLTAAEEGLLSTGGILSNTVSLEADGDIVHTGVLQEKSERSIAFRAEAGKTYRYTAQFDNGDGSVTVYIDDTLVLLSDYADRTHSYSRFRLETAEGTAFNAENFTVTDERLAAKIDGLANPENVSEEGIVMKNAEADISCKDSVSVFTCAVRFTPDADAKQRYLPVFALRRQDANTTRTLELLHVQARSGEICVRSLENTYLRLCDAQGVPLSFGEEETMVSIVYDDAAELARYYVNGILAYPKEGSAHAVQVPDLDFPRMGGLAEDIFLLESSEDDIRADVTLREAYTAEGDGTAQIAAAGPAEDMGAARILLGMDVPFVGCVGAEYEVITGGVSAGVRTAVTDTVSQDLRQGGTAAPAADTIGYRYAAVLTLEDLPDTADTYILIRPFSAVDGVQYYGGAVKLCRTQNGWTADQAYGEAGVAEHREFFDCSEIESYEGEALAFNSSGALFNFRADCAGQVWLRLASARGMKTTDTTVLEVTVDGGSPVTLHVPMGRGSILLGTVESGEHSFSVRKVSGGDFVRLYSVTLDGTFLDPAPTAVENGVTVVVGSPVAGTSLSAFTVYVQTSHESGNYYIEYPVAYQRRLTVNPYEGNWQDSASGNKQYNVDMYRVLEGYIAEKSGSSFKRLYQVLTGGEIGAAIMETAVGSDGVTEAGKAGDFIGGFHGDETLMDTPVLLLDGTPVDLSRRGTYTGTTVTFVQRTYLDRCNMTGQHVATHSQIMKIDTNGMRVKRSVSFLADEFAVRKGNCFLQMFTFARQDLTRVNAKEYDAPDLSNTVNLLDAAGNILHTVDTAAFEVRHANGTATPFPANSNNGKDIIAQYHFYGNDTNNRYAEHLGENGNGIYAKVGFNIVDASVKVESACIAVRRDVTAAGGVHGDNKWYPSFTSVNDPTVCLSSLGVNAQNKAGITHAGETWNVDLIYYIDYNPAQ